ncbi:TonB-dependent siderophore receptor [Bacteriovorax sp. DB6_IX]|uniref:TonB-dependent receptor plug domain-containing protein n=1 Tax=Bacteriovorax sp. DB6_IX TaxID=1353530 RepID=UPI00038A00E4|nr:TonB-dependent receptor [Bacteriovorax sp. DB6_IX]EQC45102.1 TonB-dependent receptor plug domain protein [Bacteriovorax sp. DB6_IX]
MGNFLYGLLALILSGSAAAQSSQTAVDETLYIIGSKIETSSGLIDSAIKTEIMNSQDLENGHYQDLSEAVNEIPGVTQMSVDRRSSAKTALIQGFGVNSVLVMIDGTPVSQNSAFGFDLTQISTENIERVEVIKGGASALYGSQAIGGVINIVTKRPTNKPSLKFDISSSVTQEELSSQKYKALYTGRTGKVGQKYSLSYSDQRAFDLDKSSIAKDSADVESINGSIYLDRQFGKHKLHANYIYLQGDVSSQGSKPYSSSLFGPIVNETQTKTHHQKIGHEIKLKNGTLKTTASFERIDDRLNLNDKPETSFKEMDKKTRYDAYRVDLKYDALIGEHHNLSTGILYKKDIVDQRTKSQETEEFALEKVDIDNKQVHSFEVFAQDNMIFGDYEISPGLRIQDDSSTSISISPKISFSMYKELGSINSKTWLSLGTGRRSPSIKERFFTLDHSSVGNYIVKGNENLSQERSVSIQLGDEISYAGSKLHVNFFYNKIKGLIESTEIESSTSTKVFSYENISSVVSRGLEASTDIKINNNNKLKLNYTYTETFNEETNLYLLSRPFYTGTMSYTFSPNSKHHINTTYHYIGKKYQSEDNTQIVPHYSTVDLKYNYKMNKKFDLYGGLKNIFNQTKSAALDTVTPINDDRPALGRTAYFGLRINAL